MKKLASVFLMLGCLYANARQISPGEALTFASDFMNSAQLRSASGSRSMKQMKAPGICSESKINPFYVFNRGQADGFVIISGDDRAPKILGYSDHGTFDAENLPPQLKAMMEQWSTQMSNLPTGASQHPSWTASTKTRSGDAILLETAEWGQGYPFNALCPIIEGEQAPAGCVATAMAIAMKYHNWPDYTRGDVQTDYYHPELAFDFSDYTIDWKVLDDKNNPKFGEEVSKLMFSAGVCNSMYYGPLESSAQVWPIGHKMIELYTYAKGCQFVVKEKYSDSEWESLLKNQLSTVGPVIYNGSGEIGHCFILDGYNSEGLFHVNWGWDGLSNGYYSLDFNGENGPSFPNNHGMIINLRPDKERKVYSKAFIPNVKEYQSQEWNFLEPDIRQGERNIVLIPTITQNCFNGYYGLAVVDNEDNIKEIFYTTAANAGIRYSCSYPGIYFGNTNQGDNGILFPKLNEGERYQLVTMDATYETNNEENPGFWTWIPSKPSDKPEDWKIVLGGIDYPSHFYATGNKSEVSEVTLHVDEKLPAYLECYRLFPEADPLKVRQLKWEAFGENYFIPRKGVTFTVKGRDKEGNSTDVLINDSDYDGTTNVYSMTLTMNQEFFDVFINYTPDPDTRKDSGYDPKEIVTDNGIVYRIEGESASVIGYDDIPESVIVPSEINTPGGTFPVTSVVGDAFLHAPVKHLSFDRGNLLMYELSFAGMDKLESISFDNDDFYPGFRWGLPFVKSPFKYFYSSRCPDPWDMQYILDIKPWVANWDYWEQDKPFDAAVSDHNNVALYISNAIKDPESDFYQLTRLLDYLEEVKSVYHLDDVIASVNIPGVGELSSAISEIQKYDLPVNQMWSYALDKTNGLIKIDNIIPEVKINGVLINGELVVEGSDGLFHYPKQNSNNLTVTIQCVINDEKKFETSYSSDYNSSLKDFDLSSGVEIIDDASEFGLTEVYNLQGVRLIDKASRADVNNLPSGTYIIGNRKVVIAK